jgi:Transposase
MALGVEHDGHTAMPFAGAHAPHAIMTFDRFHVIKLMNERLDDLRRQLAREAHDHNAKEVIKGLRWLLLHRRDNLEKDAVRRLGRSLALNEPLQCAYLLKEELGEKRRTRGLGIAARNGARRQQPAASGNSKLWRRPSFAMPREVAIEPKVLPLRKDAELVRPVGKKKMNANLPAQEPGNDRHCYGLCQAGDLFGRGFLFVVRLIHKRPVRARLRQPEPGGAQLRRWRQARGNRFVNKPSHSINMGDFFGRFLFFLPKGLFSLQRANCYSHAPKLCAPAL